MFANTKTQGPQHRKLVEGVELFISRRLGIEYVDEVPAPAMYNKMLVRMLDEADELSSKDRGTDIIPDEDDEEQVAVRIFLFKGPDRVHPGLGQIACSQMGYRHFPKRQRPDRQGPDKHPCKNPMHNNGVQTGSR